MASRFLILHGWRGSDPGHWQTWLAPPDAAVGRTVLVAPPCPAAGVAELDGFYPVPLDREALGRAARATRLVCSDDDPYCPGGAAAYYGAPLGLVVDLVPGAGHLNTDAGYGPWPAMQAWALGAAGYVAGANQGAEM